jgi:hypothetical protein
MNYSLAFAAGKAKKDLAIGLKPLIEKIKDMRGLLLFVELVFVVE